MKHVWRPLTLLLLVILITLPPSLPSRAQDDPEHPLLQMLALVPDIDPVRKRPDETRHPVTTPWVQFVNYRAALDANPDWPRPADYADYLAQVVGGREEMQYGPAAQRLHPDLPQLWVGTGTERDPVTLNRSGPTVGEVMPEKMGMDYFDITYGMQIGTTNRTGLIFGGDFDLDAIGAAHLGRGYTEQDIQGMRVWCSGRPEVGCTNISENNIEEVETYNLFDDRLGHQPPFFGVDQMIAGAFDYDLLLAMIDTATGSQASLADADDFRTLAEALTDPERYSSELIEAVFFQLDSVVQTLDLNAFSSAENFARTWGGDIGVRNPDAFLIPLDWQTYGPLPAYKMVAIGDRQESGETLTLIAVLYDNQADADAALPELTMRLTNYAGTVERQQYEPLIGQDRLRSSYVYSSATTGWSAAVVTFGESPPDPQNEDLADHNVLSVCLHGLTSMTFYPLWHITLADWYMSLERPEVPAAAGD